MKALHQAHLDTRRHQAHLDTRRHRGPCAGVGERVDPLVSGPSHRRDVGAGGGSPTGAVRCSVPTAAPRGAVQAAGQGGQRVNAHLGPIRSRRRAQGPRPRQPFRARPPPASRQPLQEVLGRTRQAGRSGRMRAWPRGPTWSTRGLKAASRVWPHRPCPAWAGRNGGRACRQEEEWGGGRPMAASKPPPQQPATRGKGARRLEGPPLFAHG